MISRFIFAACFVSLAFCTTRVVGAPDMVYGCAGERQDVVHVHVKIDARYSRAKVPPTVIVYESITTAESRRKKLSISIDGNPLLGCASMDPGRHYWEPYTQTGYEVAACLTHDNNKTDDSLHEIKITSGEKKCVPWSLRVNHLTSAPFGHHAKHKDWDTVIGRAHAWANTEYTFAPLFFVVLMIITYVTNMVKALRFNRMLVAQLVVATLGLTGVVTSFVKRLFFDVFLNVGRLVNPDGLFVGIVMTVVISAAHVSAILAYAFILRSLSQRRYKLRTLLAHVWIFGISNYGLFHTRHVTQTACGVGFVLFAIYII